jgi:hypothetical protein
LYHVWFRAMMYIGWTTWVWDHARDEAGREGRKQQLLNPQHPRCPKFVQTMHRLARVCGGEVTAEPVLVLTNQGPRRSGRKRELLATVHGMRQPTALGGASDNAHRVRGACFVHGAVLHPRDARFGSTFRRAYQDCVVSLPADADGLAEGPLPEDVDAALEALAVRHPEIIGAFLDNQ